MDVGQTYVRGKTGLNVGRKVSEKQYRKGQYCRDCDGKEGECASEVELAYHAVHTSEIEHASDVVDEGDSIDSQKDEQDCERHDDGNVNNSGRCAETETHGKKVKRHDAGTPSVGSGKNG